mmetsp:Transcript_78665/g.151979  ORF Transcript_78665/g.151979 Transcript_78665/m.151979 type:complete len:92 (+) Transcript_78665:175-450(+)
MLPIPSPEASRVSEFVFLFSIVLFLGSNFCIPHSHELGTTLIASDSFQFAARVAAVAGHAICYHDGFYLRTRACGLCTQKCVPSSNGYIRL